MAETLRLGLTTCPKDGSALVLRPMPLHIGQTITGLFWRCPNCGTEYDQRAMITGSGSSTQSAPSAFGTGHVSLLGLGSTEAALESAYADTRLLRSRIEKLEAEVQRHDAPADSALRSELSDLRKGLDSVEVRIQKTAEEFANLLPSATDVAYLKFAKAEATELRNLLTKHIEEDHRRKTLERALEANRLARIAIAVSLMAIIAAMIGLTR